MFHMMLAAPVLAVFGAMGAAVVAVLGLLLGLGFFYFFFAEFGRSDVWHYTMENRALVSWFQAVTPRTAGFNTADLTALSDATVLCMIFLMIIGGSPSSTAGGLKTTTLAMLVASLASIFKKRKNI